MVLILVAIVGGFVVGLCGGILLTFWTLRRRGFVFFRHSTWVYRAERTMGGEDDKQ